MEATEEKDLILRIEAALEQIRPYMITDGGDISLLGVTKDKVVRVQLLGACSSCKMSAMTMKAGVEESIRKAVPEILAVEAVM